MSSEKNKSGFEKMKKNYKNSHQKNVLFLPNENVLPLIEEQIAAGKSVKLRVRGNSMFPRLMDGRDMVALHHVDPLQIKVGDVIFFRWGKGFLMHRVIEIVEGHQGARPLKFVTRGDALRSTEVVPIEDVIALAELPAHSPRTLRMRRVRGWLQRVRGLLRRVWGWVMRLLRR
jgi:signal peptidase I